jgi:HlyD family secretion protein
MRNLRLPALLLMLSLFLGGCSKDDRRPGGSGLLEASEVVVSSEVGGRVMKLLFDEGTTVAPTDTLLLIDATRPQLELAAAEADLEVIRANLRLARIQAEQAASAEEFALSERSRIEKLLASNTATRKQMDLAAFEYVQAEMATRAARARVATVKAQLQKTEVNIDRIKLNLDDCYPLSPMGGMVTARYVDEGELLGPGKPIGRISRLDSLWVKVYLPAAALVSVKIGDTAWVDTESGGDTYPGLVIWTSPEAEFTPKNVQTQKSRANLVYAVKVKLANDDRSLKVGMPVYVTIGVP